ncbi:hypothetical protein NDU88_006232 [Pleurodeles waltl]|uniref:Uncharacterized protein n=1 Tax=Pleurodeles waltl TaxID=8319 RepID=A0AAV7VM83_PLEWA|nr:hypothetical protein NDU88_006232 [Pleurodeles waltl]
MKRTCGLRGPLWEPVVSLGGARGALLKTSKVLAPFALILTAVMEEGGRPLDGLSSVLWSRERVTGSSCSGALPGLPGAADLVSSEGLEVRRHLAGLLVLSGGGGLMPSDKRAWPSPSSWVSKRAKDTRKLA